ncbi:AraC family transcriptional regulator [Alcanivorax hongdengensis A-11-3]|uniref:AraC family transcriptional regulator n=1 Tax=Alcanivorax hongdengensis A-11-3 TaxID=1177179 RepID=L0WB71_9GAMM|nr:AraC family transcriptional regulator [Alcanivorax hongdengensis]EKF73342.1 AraC family transcriptional regulator [Alcanivorax hongdengensis A-11-3]
MPPVLDPALAGSDQSLSSAYVATVLPELAAHYGLDSDALLARAGIDPRVLAQSDALLPLVDVLRLFLVVLDASADSGLGFEVGKRVKPRAYQVLGYVILASSTLGEAIDRLVRFEALSGKLGSTRLCRDGDQVRLNWYCPLTGEPGRFLTEAAITGWVAFMRPLLPSGLAPLLVRFRHGAPQDEARYPAFFQSPVQFGAEHDGVDIAASLLDTPLNTADPGLAVLMEREARALLTDFESGTNLLSAVRAQCYQQLADGEPTLEAVAGALSLTPRNLQARLRKQGMGFQEVLDGLRQSLAELYLQDPALSLTDIALLLGFAESSSFTRAFRRWRSMSPNQWRRRG